MTNKFATFEWYLWFEPDLLISLRAVSLKLVYTSEPPEGFSKLPMPVFHLQRLWLRQGCDLGFGILKGPQENLSWSKCGKSAFYLSLSCRLCGTGTRSKNKALQLLPRRISLCTWALGIKERLQPQMRWFWSLFKCIQWFLGSHQSV